MAEHPDIPRTSAGEPPEAPAGRPAATGGLLGQNFQRSPRFADSFGLVLVMLIVSYFVTAVAGDHVYGRVVMLLVFATTTWLALRASQVERRLLRLAVALIPLATVVAIALVLVGNETTAKIVTASLTGLLVVVAPVAIVKRLATHPMINLNTFYGAVCVYLLIAMFFATAFAFISVLSHHPFFAQTKTPGSIGYLYFSFTTITTVGYGDLTAAGGVGRMTAVLEAVFGQLYLITVVALVVQNLGQERRAKLHKEDDD
jgi:hypothetical protein